MNNPANNVQTRGHQILFAIMQSGEARTRFGSCYFRGSFERGRLLPRMTHEACNDRRTQRHGEISRQQPRRQKNPPRDGENRWWKLPGPALLDTRTSVWVSLFSTCNTTRICSWKPAKSCKSSNPIFNTFSSNATPLFLFLFLIIIKIWWQHPVI